jgi:hypothetical protein
MTVEVVDAENLSPRLATENVGKMVLRKKFKK